MVELAQIQHKTGGHFMQDMVKLKLMDKYYSSRVDQAIVKGINSCGRCKSFGPTHIHSLLEPITHRHPFKLFVADYPSMPMGTGGFHTIALLMDTFTHWHWGVKLKTHSTAKPIHLQHIQHTGMLNDRWGSSLQLRSCPGLLQKGGHQA